MSLLGLYYGKNSLGLSSGHPICEVAVLGRWETTKQALTVLYAAVTGDLVERAVDSPVNIYKCLYTYLKMSNL